MINKLILYLIKFYQKYLTILSYGSCRYYPTCSSYAKIQFEHNNIFKAILLSTLRILKCNPLFDGGFDYVKVKRPRKKEINLSFTKIKIKVKYWKIPADDDYCYIIKQRLWKKNI